jgi:hypothetical protein
MKLLLKILLHGLLLCLSIPLSIRLSIQPPCLLSIHPSNQPTIYRYICLSVCLSTLYPICMQNKTLHFSSICQHVAVITERSEKMLLELHEQIVVQTLHLVLKIRV